MGYFAYGCGFVLVALGLAASVAPVLPGVPLVFGGLWLIAAVDGYRHVGLWWLVCIAVVGGLGLALDLAAGALGAKRVGASSRAIGGAFAGSLIGLFFGLPGILCGPFVGALLGELSAGNSVLRSTSVGVGAWIGLLFGAIIKVAASVAMVSLFLGAWWWNRVSWK